MNIIFAYFAAAACVVIGSAVNNLYLFWWGCTWFLTSAILESRNEARRTRERLEDIVHAFDPLAPERTGAAVAQAINASASRASRSGAR